MCYTIKIQKAQGKTSKLDVLACKQGFRNEGKTCMS